MIPEEDYDDSGKEPLDDEDAMWLREGVYIPFPMLLSASGCPVANPNFSSIPKPHRWNYQRRKRNRQK